MSIYLSGLSIFGVFPAGGIREFVASPEYSQTDLARGGQDPGNAILHIDVNISPGIDILDSPTKTEKT